ncbi:trihelix transcription factor PTL-like [Nymphaea colorata]|nr:trihelix transcription factor PTL-like [Nymphaea colorata]
MDMGGQYARTELEALLKSHHHHFLPPLPLPSVPSASGLSVTEMMAQSPFKLPGFFHGSLFGRPHHPGMMVTAEDEAAAQLGCSMDYGAERLDFCSGSSIPTTATNLIANVANGAGDLLFSSHSNENNNNCDGGRSGENMMRFMGTSSSPSEKMEDREGGGDGGSSRWPRHETLTLLELRAQMDSKFREATQKGPLWEELSREMAEGYGYHRSGKKCREKFENLYKYYKKTKLGRMGRQDGKHYRFYAQLEALCGGGEGRTTNNSSSITPNVNSSTNSQFDHELHNGRGGKKALEEKTKVDSPSISESDMAMGSSDSSEEDLGIEKGKKKKKQKTAEGKSWRKKMKVYIEKQMKVFIDRQEEWFERIVKTLERREEERLATEEAWRKQENERLQVEHQFWAKERAWMQARDSTFIEALRKVMGQECTRASSSPPSPPLSFDLKEMQELETNKEDQALYNTSNNNNESTSSSSSSRRWPKHEILSLIRLRTAMDGRFQEGVSKGSLWEEISLKMTQLGYEKSGKRCKEKWENINKYFRKAKECNRKRRENSKTCPYFQYLEELYDSGDIRVIHEGFDNDYCEQEQKDAEASAEGLY